MVVPHNVDVPSACPFNGWQESKFKDLAVHVFQAAHLNRLNNNATTAIDASFRRRTEGRSGTHVFELTFSWSGAIRVRFIVRVLRSSSEADSERKAIEAIQASIGSKFFSIAALGKDHEFSDVIVYRHAGDEAADLRPLPSISAFLADSGILRAQHDSEQLASYMRLFASAVTKNYNGHLVGRKADDSGSPTMTMAEYANSVCPRLPPETVVIADKNAEIEVDGNDIIIGTSDGSMPAKKVIAALETLPASHLFAGAEVKHTWVGYSGLKYHSVNGGSGVRTDGSAYCCFTAVDGAVNSSVWLRVQNAGLTLLKEVLKRGESYRLVLKGSERQAKTIGISLAALGLPDGATLPTREFRNDCSGRGSGMVIRRRHHDFHALNVLIRNKEPVVCDVGDREDDLAAADLARLEVSLWLELTKAFAYWTSTDVTAVLRDLDGSPPTTDPNNAPPEDLKRLGGILKALRNGFADAMSDDSEWKAADRAPEIRLAYVTQALLFQRYSLLDGTDIPRGFAAACHHWVVAFRSDIAKLRGATIDDVHADLDEFGNGGDADGSSSGATRRMITFPDRPQIGRPNLFDLWREAVGFSETPDRAVDDFLGELWRSRDTSNVAGEVKELSWSILQQLGQGSDPFGDPARRHVIISGPTSSGKTTVAEMFLASAPLRNQKRRCAVYVAPTRALAQERHRELVHKFPSMENRIVLSTGEDQGNDFRITNGDFDIACMVYEKANIHFSLRAGLLDRVGCVVVDEIHMLTNLDRGPVLEIMLAKVLSARFEQDSFKKIEPVRLVVISTEDGGDNTLERFLSISDAEGTPDAISPWVLASPLRPVAVEHFLVLPGKRRPEYFVHMFLKFRQSTDRCITKDQQAPILNRLFARLKKEDYGKQKIGPDEKMVYGEMCDRLIRFLVDRLAERPVGHRILVFVASRDGTTDLARRLKVQMEAVAGAGAPPPEKPISDQLKAALAEIEQDPLGKLLGALAVRGLYAHHSDIPHDVRQAVELICSSPVLGQSEVLFCTSTLAYGVNLAISEVVMMGTTFNTSDRFGVEEKQDLTVCEYHNMVGRVGRLGKTAEGTTPRVFVMVPGNEPSPEKSIIIQYYTKINTVQSVLFHQGDKKQLISNSRRPENELKNGGERFGIAKVVDFSYPFARAVLEVLRHLNQNPLNPGIGDPDAYAWVTASKIETFLREHTLYGRQKVAKNVSNRKAELEIFSAAIRSVLWDGADGGLDIVTANGGPNIVDRIENRGYQITIRGEAAIDTGTDLRTIAPLMRLQQDARSEWKRTQGAVPVPAGLFVLPLVAPKEVYLKLWKSTPECRIQKQGGRDFLNDEERNKAEEESLGAFAASLADIGAPEPRILASGLSKVLASALQEAEWSPDYQAVLRFFNAMTQWIRGDSRGNVARTILGKKDSESTVPGFTAYVEQLNWKAVCLSRMLGHELPPLQQRELQLLAYRLRYGCVVDAVPLFAQRPPRPTRDVATALLKAGLAPATILATAPKDDAGTIAASVEEKDRLRERTMWRIPALRTKLIGYATNELADLVATYIAKQGEDRQVEVADAVRAIGGRHDGIFRRTVDCFPRNDKGEAAADFVSAIIRPLTRRVGSDSVLATRPRGKSTQKYLIEVEMPEKGRGMLLKGYRSQVAGSDGDDLRSPEEIPWREDQSVTVVPVQIRSDWNASFGGTEGWIPFDALLRELLSKHEHLAVVPFPWIPATTGVSRKRVRELLRAVSAPSNVCLVSPAAFATLLYFPVRGFIAGDDVMKLLTSDSGISACGYTAINLADVVDLVKSLADTPPIIQERMIGHFEVSIPTTLNDRPEES